MRQLYEVLPTLNPPECMSYSRFSHTISKSRFPFRRVHLCLFLLFSSIASLVYLIYFGLLKVEVDRSYFYTDDFYLFMLSWAAIIIIFLIINFKTGRE